MTDSNFFYSRRLLYGIWLISLIVGYIIVANIGKGDAVLFLNQHYGKFTVPFFSLMTRMGEGMGFIIPFLYFLFFKPYKFQVGHLLVGVLTLVLVYFFKHIVYPDAIRPIVYFEQLNIDLLNRSDIPLNRKYTFPSGHTTAGFAYFFYAALSANKRVFSLLFFSTAVLIGVSRIFLAQHFLIDVLAGSTLGVAIASVVFYFVIHKNVFKSSALDKRLIDVKG